MAVYGCLYNWLSMDTQLIYVSRTLPNLPYKHSPICKKYEGKKRDRPALQERATNIPSALKHPLSTSCISLTQLSIYTTQAND